MSIGPAMYFVYWKKHTARRTINLSQTDKLLSNILEYNNLLGFLNEKHPTVLDEWKNNSAGLVAQTQHQQMQKPPEVNLNGNYTN